MAKKVSRSMAKGAPVANRPVPDPCIAPAGEPVNSSSADGLSRADVQNIRRLLESKTVEGVSLGISLMQAAGASRADYEAVFTEKSPSLALKAALETWDAETWAVVSRAILPYPELFAVFEACARHAFAWHLNKGRDASFDGLAVAMIPAARASFLAAWCGTATREKPFIDIVQIPAGAFTMGSPDDEAGRSDDECQVSAVITTPFCMGRTVVTQGQWRAVMGSEPWQLRNQGWAGIHSTWEKANQVFDDDAADHCGDDYPATQVSWHEAELFCKTLADLERETGRLAATQAYRLPTEAEWEYACRAGTTTAYSFGSDPERMGDYGWSLKNSSGAPHPVAAKLANAWGLFDMHGNVFEWCADWYATQLAGGEDPVGPGTGKSKVRRGGRWDTELDKCRSAYRNCSSPHERFDGTGFRVVLVN